MLVTVWHEHRGYCIAGCDSLLPYLLTSSSCWVDIARTNRSFQLLECRNPSPIPRAWMRRPQMQSGFHARIAPFDTATQ